MTERFKKRRRNIYINEEEIFLIGEFCIQHVCDGKSI